VWTLVTLLSCALTWSLFQDTPERSTDTATHGAGAQEAQEAQEAQGALAVTEGVDEAVRQVTEERADQSALSAPAPEGDEPAQRALRWRVEGARLGEAGLSPCAPVGWRGERVSPLDLQAGAEPSGVIWRPPSIKEGVGLQSQAILLKEGALILLSHLSPEELKMQGAVGQSLMRHQRLASCVMGPGAELHDPWLSKSWGAKRWRSASPLESLDRWVLLSTAEGGWHHSVGLSRLGLPEHALDQGDPQGRALLRTLLRAWLLGVRPEALGLGSWSLIPSDELNDWLGGPDMLVWRPQNPGHKVSASSVNRSTRRLSAQARRLRSSLESRPARAQGKGKRDERARPQSGRRSRQRRRAPIKSAPTPGPVKRLKLQYD